MDRKLQNELRAAFHAPAPERKAAFLKQHCRRELGRWELAAVQAGYIRWWVWGLSLGLFGAILWAAGRPYRAGLVCAAALTPFLALLAVAESGRARFYHMDELELACRVPRASVVLARMLVLGLFHLALLGGLAPALAVWGAAGTARAAGAPDAPGASFGSPGVFPGACSDYRHRSGSACRGGSAGSAPQSPAGEHRNQRAGAGA